MLKVKVTVNSHSKEFMGDIQRAQVQFVTEAGQSIRTETIVRAPVRLGNLRSSVVTESFIEDGRPTSETGATADYAPHVEYGTGIYAENGSGRQTPWMYRDEQGVWHRTVGNRAQPFAEPGFQAARQGFNAIIERVLKA